MVKMIGLAFKAMALLGAAFATLPAAAADATWFSNVGSVANTRHNMTQRAMDTVRPFGVVMDPYRGDYAGVCVYCHTPHGANGSVALPLWNRTIKATTYNVYSELNTSTLTQPVAQPGVNSLACLSCHDGQTAVDSVINMPGAGGYNASQATGQDNDFLNGWSNPSGTGPFAHMTMIDCYACHSPPGPSILSGVSPDFSVLIIGVDLRNDHPVGITYPAVAGNDDFRAVAAINGNVRYMDENSNGRPDKNEVRVFNYGSGHKVECASCHDPHGVPSGDRTTPFMPSFLRVTAEGSAICLSCHVK